MKLWACLALVGLLEDSCIIIKLSLALEGHTIFNAGLQSVKNVYFPFETTLLIFPLNENIAWNASMCLLVYHYT